jgi:hypothetical protein
LDTGPAVGVLAVPEYVAPVNWDEKDIRECPVLSWTSLLGSVLDDFGNAIPEMEVLVFDALDV